MKMETIYSNLCHYDKRSPEYQDLKDCLEDDMPEPRGECPCDNCFYRRDELAIELLKMKDEYVTEHY